MSAQQKLLPLVIVEAQSDTVANVETMIDGKWEFYEVIHLTSLDDEEYINDHFGENGHFTSGYITKEANTKIVSVKISLDDESLVDCVLAEDVKKIIVDAIQADVEQDYLNSLEY